MAPKSGVKRAAQASKNTQPSKVQKKAEEKKVEEVPKYSDPRLEGLIDAVQRSELPQSCKEMLCIMIQGSFLVPCEDRHELQAIAVRQVGELIDQMHNQMMKDVEEATASLKTAEDKKSSLEATVIEAHSQLAAAGQLLQSKETQLEETTKITSEKQTALDGAKHMQVQGHAQLEVVKEERATFQSAFTDSFKVLKNSECDALDAPKHFKVVEPLIAKLELDESLMLALPSTCQKKLCDRGSFDNVIMDQIEKKLQAQIASLEQTIESGASGVLELAEKVKAAEEELNAATASKENAAKELRDAQTKQTEATHFLDSSKKDISDFEIELQNVLKERDAKVTVQTSFEKWNIESFTTLKNKTAASQEEVAAPEEVVAPKAMMVEEVTDAPVSQAGA